MTVKVPTQIIIDFNTPKLQKLKPELEKLINERNDDEIIPITNATAFVVAMLQREVQKNKK